MGIADRINAVTEAEKAQVDAENRKAAVEEDVRSRRANTQREKAQALLSEVSEGVRLLRSKRERSIQVLADSWTPDRDTRETLDGHVRAGIVDVPVTHDKVTTTAEVHADKPFHVSGHSGKASGTPRPRVRITRLPMGERRRLRDSAGSQFVLNAECRRARNPTRAARPVNRTKGNHAEHRRACGRGAA